MKVVIRCSSWDRTCSHVREKLANNKQKKVQTCKGDGPKAGARVGGAVVRAADGVTDIEAAELGGEDLCFFASSIGPSEGLGRFTP